MQPNQWQQQPYGFNPGMQQQGFGQQPQQQRMGGAGPGFMNAQATGYPGGAQQQRPLQTGMPGGMGMGGMGGMSGMGMQPTGQPQGGSYSFLNAPPAQGSFGGPQRGGAFSGQGMQAQMTGFPGGGASGLMPQQTGYGMMSQPTGMGGGLMSQPTGMGMRPQPTGMHDPRLGAMMQTFMPSNLSQPFSASGAPQFSQGPSQPLANTFQSLLSNPNVKTPKVPWTLTKQEKKDYDQIFRAWEKGDGFISGETAREVFGQSGLGQDDLMKIWNLSDVDNRGKLNLPEFHVAMGLIYRALNGNDIPDKLPEELVPASMRDIEGTVNFMRDLLKHESTSRSGTSSPGGYGSGYTPSAQQAKDAKVYKHDDSSTGGYKSSARHIDRKAVRYAGEDASDEISDLRRQLDETSAMLDKQTKDSERKNQEDEELEQEIEDIKYRVRRIKEDIDYVSKGRRSQEKDDERRKLERELLHLMHEKLPELERRQERRAEEKRMEERAGARARDKRNEVHGRYDDRNDDSSWLRGTYDRDSGRRGSRDTRDREYGRDRDRFDRDDDYRRDRDRSRDRFDDRDDRRGGSRYDDRDRRDSTRDTERRDSRDRRGSDGRDSPRPSERPRSPAKPAPVVAPKPVAAKQAEGKPVKSLAQMSPEERKAYLKEQAQRKIQERLRALGVESASPEPIVDNTVEERLAQERKEAEEKARLADKEQEAREEARRQRLASARGDAPAEEATTKAPPAPAPLAKAAVKKPGPPPPAPRHHKAPPPPSPRKAATPAVPAPPPAPKQPEVDPEEEELRRQEEAREKAKAERRERLKRLQEEEEEERRKEEELLNARKARAAASAQSSLAPAAPVAEPTTPDRGSFNPFHRKLSNDPAAKSPSQPQQSFNPFFRPPPANGSMSGSAPPPPPPAPPAPPAQEHQASPPPAPTPPPPPPAPPAPSYPRANSAPPPDDDWDVIQEKDQDESDSSDDEYAKSRASRGKLASALFGNVLGANNTGSRPSSSSSSPTTSKPPPAALANLGGGAPTGGGMSALLSSIQGGAKLRKAETVVKGVPEGGRVIGDAAPPPHITNAPISVSPPTPQHQPLTVDEDDDFQGRHDHRQSGDWYGSLAADQAHPAAEHAGNLSLDPTREEDEREDDRHLEPPVEQMAATSVSDGPSLDDVDQNITLHVRTLYNYETSFDGDLPFQENVVLEAHPAKDPNGPWWFGTLANGEAGWFPSSYVQDCLVKPCKALYDYSATTGEELSFSEGDNLAVVDQSDPDWWKVEKDGAILLVPASYVEVVGAKPPATERIDEHADSGIKANGQDVTDTDSMVATPGHIPRPDVHIDVPSPRTLSSPLIETPTLATERTPVAEPSSHLDVRRSAPAPPQRQRSHSNVANIIRESSGDSPARSRATSVSQYSVHEDDDESSDDSVLSFWSSEDEESDEEDNNAAAEAQKEEERKRREAERQKALAAAGLKIRREPPGIPKTRRRRPAPAVPVRHSGSHEAQAPPTQPEPEPEKAIEVEDAYARYQAFLAEAKQQPKRNSQVSRPTSVVIEGPTLSASPSQSTGLFSGLLSKIGVPLGGNEKPAPRISGPVISGPMSSSEPEEDSFGKTWGSLVDPSVLSTMSDEERKRQEAIFEFIATEGSYVRDLQLIVGVYYAALMDVLDDQALKVIFANVEDILMLNTFFFSSLEDRQKACRLYIDTIGDVLAEHCQNLQVYTPYCVNQDQARKLLLQLRKENPQLERTLLDIRENNPAVRGLELSSFLLAPMQRITRYPLLLKQIAHYTRPDQDLELVQKAKGYAETTVAHINENVREAEGNERLRVLSDDLWVGGEGRIDLTEPTQYQGPRRLIKEGPVAKAKSGRQLSMVLCTDVIILIESRNLYRMPIPLHEVTLQQGRDDTSFALVTRDTVRLKAASNAQRIEWISAITKARKENLTARDKNARRQSRADSVMSQEYGSGYGSGGSYGGSGSFGPPGAYVRRGKRPSLTPPELDQYDQKGRREERDKQSIYDHQF